MKNKKFIISILLIAIMLISAFAVKVNAASLETVGGQDDETTLSQAFTNISKNGGTIQLLDNVNLEEAIDIRSC